MKNNIPTITEISTETAAKFAKTTTDEKKAIAIGDKNAHINDNPIIRNGLLLQLYDLIENKFIIPYLKNKFRTFSRKSNNPTIQNPPIFVIFSVLSLFFIKLV